jgi:Domain of unknown function (DUF4157)
MHDHDDDHERRRLREARAYFAPSGPSRPAPGRSTVTSRLPPRPAGGLQRRASSGAREIDLDAANAALAPAPASNPAPWGPGVDPFGMSHLWAEPAAPDGIGGAVAPGARDGLARAVGLDPAPVQRRAGADVGRSAERAPVTIDAPKEVEETRATLDVEPEGAALLGEHQLAAARRANPAWHRRLRYDAAVFGGDLASDDYAIAVAGFQHAHRLGVDGIAGPRTIEAAGAARGPARARSASSATRDPWSGVAAAAPDDDARAAFAAIDPLAAMVEPDRGAERAPVTIDAPKEVEESRATLDVDAPPAVALQMRAASPTGPAAAGTDDRTHAIAATGVAGGGAPLPYLADLKQSFGRHGDALDAVRVHTGPDATRAARAIRADAYASGSDIALAAAPTRDLIGHEAAHIVQQRAGVALEGGVGDAGDAYEQHADDVGAAFAAGGSAEALLDRFAQTGDGPAAPSVQMRRESSPKESLTSRVSQAVHDKLHERCDDKGADEGCFLGAEDEMRLHELITKNVLLAAMNWKDALTDARLVELTKHESGWTAFLEIVFHVGVAYLTEGVGEAVDAFGAAAKTVPSVQIAARLVNHQKAVEQAFESASEGIKVPLEAAAESAAAKTNDAAADFLGRLKEVPTRWANHLLEGYKGSLNDWGQLLLYGLTDPEHVLSTAHFTEEIAKLLQRWETQVNEIGQPTNEPFQQMRSYESCAWVTPRNGGLPRLARVTRSTTVEPTGGPNLLGNAGLHNPVLRFRTWVDDDMVSMALDKWGPLGDGIDMVTLDDFENPPPDGEAWERRASASGVSEEPVLEQKTRYSHEAPIRSERR